MIVDNPAIEMDGFSFSINGKTILKDITITVRKGECISIIGPNGSGKTTLLKCLDRIYTAGTGGIRVDGKPLATYSRRELAQCMSYVPQADGNMLPFTVQEFVMMGRYPYLKAFSPPDSRDEEAVTRALALTGTTGFADRGLSTLSGGERQRVFIAAALAQEAGILLLDEPATFLDIKNQSEIHGLLESINREQGTTILSVTHDINAALLTSHRILALKDGSVAFWGDSEGLLDREVLRDIFEKSFLFVEHPGTGKKLVVTDVP